MGLGGYIGRGSSGGHDWLGSHSALTLTNPCPGMSCQRPYPQGTRLRLRDLVGSVLRCHLSLPKTQPVILPKWAPECIYTRPYPTRTAYGNHRRNAERQPFHLSGVHKPLLILLPAMVKSQLPIYSDNDPWDDTRGPSCLGEGLGAHKPAVLASPQVYNSTSSKGSSKNPRRVSRR